MGWLFGNDRNLAETKYAGREAASETAARKRRESHRRKGIAKAEKSARKWEAADRRRFNG